MYFLKKSRTDKKISKKEMAKKMNISLSGYKKLEYRINNLTMKRFVQVCNILDLDIKEAITEAIKDV